MITDYLDTSVPRDHVADLCIIGAGAAGIAIARSFLGTSTTVCLIEGGGAGGEESSQALYEGPSVGCPPLEPGSTRMRAFGGSCNLWGGGCIPLDELDMARRDWVPGSGWPISPADLEPYYRRARSYCQIGAHELTEKNVFSSPLAHAPIAFDADMLVNSVFVRTPVVFGKAYRAELERSSNISVLLHANLRELEASADGTSVRQIKIGTLDGRQGTVRARHFVLACGGIENARQLLLSNAVVPQGLGNQRDTVGRYFMDHPSGKMGTVFADAPGQTMRAYDRSRSKVPMPAFPEIALSPAYQRRHRLLSGRVRAFAIEGTAPPGVQALRDFRRARGGSARDESALLEERLLEATRNGPRPHADSAGSSAGTATQAFRVLRGSGDIVRALAQKLAGKPAVPARHLELIGYFEQAPNPHSRITLDSTVDALGQRKVRVDWRLTLLDRQTYAMASTLFGNELARACGGEFRREGWLDELDVDGSADAMPQVHGTAHHLGTTRMSDDPSQGVVDRDCKVHGIDNLHVAGSSVFPTGGWAFPTFTIVALSLRLADNLGRLLSKSRTLL